MGDNLMEPKFRLRYYVTVDDFYEYMKYVDRAQRPARKIQARNSMLLSLGVCAALCLFVLLMPGTEKLIALFPVGMMAVVVFIFFSTKRRIDGADKMLNRLQSDANRDKPGFKDPMELELFDNRIMLTTEEGMRHIQYIDIDWVEESENLYIIKLKESWDCLVRDIGRILIPKRVLGESSWSEMEAYIIEARQAQVARRQSKKRG